MTLRKSLLAALPVVAMGLASATSFAAPEAGLAKAEEAAVINAKAVRSGRTKTLHELQREYEQRVPSAVKSGAINEIRVPARMLDRNRFNVNDESQQRSPELINSFSPALNAPAADISAEGYSSDDNVALIGGRVTPPDTNGDVGLNHYVQYVNLGWVVLDKNTGNTVAGPFVGNLFWQGFGGVCETQNAGDPIVLYDHLAGRWLFSQFTGTSVSDGHQCVAVSDGEDPTGPYTLYDFVVSPNAFNDYPKITVWPDGYYMTTHEFGGPRLSFQGVNLTVFDRTAMLAGDPNAGFIQFSSLTSAGDALEFGLQVGHLEGNDLPPAGTCNHLVHATDVEAFGISGSDRFRFWRACVDFANPANSTLTQLGGVATPAFDQNFCGFSRDCIDQNSSSNTTLDALAGFSIYRFNQRYFPTEGVLKGAITTNVDVGSDRAGVMWAGFDIDPASGAASIGDNGDLLGVIDFNDGINRWMGSAAVDAVGNIGIGYTVASTPANVFPSIRFTVHERGVDGPGQVQGESVCVNGSGSTEGANRWADYSSTSVDPVDQCTFWHTNEYVETTGNFQWNTRVCSFRLASCDGGGGNLPPDAQFSSNCTDLSCSFDGSASSDADGSIVSYDWSFGDGNNGSGVTTSHTYASGGSFTVTLTVTDDAGATGSSSQTITVVDPNQNQPPVAQFSSSCTDLSCSFDGSASSDADGSIVSYAWSFGDGNSGSGITTSHTYGAGGSFTVTLTVTDDDGATDSASQTVTVTDPNEPVIDLSVRTTGPFARLNWSGATGSTVDVFRNGAFLKNTANDGEERDRPGNGTFTYEVCNAGSTTACSNPVTVSF